MARTFVAGTIGSSLWMLATLAALRPKRRLPEWQELLLRWGTTYHAILTGAGAVGFWVVTMRNPYRDLANGYSAVVTLAATLASALFGFLLVKVREKQGFG